MLLRARVHASSCSSERRSASAVDDQQVELLAVAGDQILLHEPAVLLLLLGVGGLRVGRRKQPAQDRLVWVVEQRAELRGQLAQHLPVVASRLRM